MMVYVLPTLIFRHGKFFLIENGYDQIVNAKQKNVVTLRKPIIKSIHLHPVKTYSYQKA